MVRSTHYGHTNNDANIMQGGKIYDYNPYDDPTQQSYYELAAQTDFQSRGGSNKAVSVEHILEWQVLLVSSMVGTYWTAISLLYNTSAPYRQILADEPLLWAFADTCLL
jgi:hypothetical protein